VVGDRALGAPWMGAIAAAAIAAAAAATPCVLVVGMGPACWLASCSVLGLLVLSSAELAAGPWALKGDAPDAQGGGGGSTPAGDAWSPPPPPPE